MYLLAECHWLNPTPQSVRFCRQLRIAFEKEDESTTIREFEKLEVEKENLRPHKFTLPNGTSITIDYDVKFTLFDGKCLNTIMHNASTTTCYLCGYKSSQFNKPWRKFVPKARALKFGLGLLHLEINTFNHFLKLGYKKDNGSEFHSWTVKKENKGNYKIYLLSVCYFRAGNIIISRREPDFCIIQ